MTYSDVENFVLAQNLGLDQSARTNCPVCKNAEQSFSITRHHDGKIAYMCFRASCGVHGYVGTTLTKHDWEGYLDKINTKHDQFSQKFEIPEYIVQTLDNDLTKDYLKRYPWVARYEDLRWDIREHRLVYVIKDEKDKPRCAWGRAMYPRKGQPKMKFYGKDAYPIVFEATELECIVVEDMTSALRLYEKGYSAAPIMGTHLSDGYIAPLRKYKKVHVCLDFDATGKGISIVRKLRSQGIDACITMLTEHDIKDMDADQFKEFTQRITGDSTDGSTEEST